MGHTRNEVVIDAPYDLVFEVSNHIERWTELFGDEYLNAEVLERKDNEIVFRLTNKEGQSWVSKRWLHKDQKFAFASRHDPMFPFKYMKIIWLYHEIDCKCEDGKARTLMTWIQDFEMDKEFKKFTAEQIEGFIDEHSKHNMKIFKEVIEKEAEAVK